MRLFYKNIAVFMLTLLISGCMTPKPQVQKSTFIVMKMPSIRYADQGFISTAEGVTKVEIYSSGTAVMRLEITNHSICSGSFACMSRGEFNRRFLSSSYPADTIGRIFRGEKIFGGVGISSKADGFSQSISKSSLYSINYSVLNGSIIFRDTINNILIKVRDN